MLMSPYLCKKVWGGDLLETKLNKTGCTSLGESWEVSVRDGCESRISGGEYAGMTLRGYLSKCDNSHEFDLLVKFIGANDALSVQVHPGLDAGKCEKNEFWYVVYAESDSRIVYGVREGVTHHDLAKADGDEIEQHLNYVNVHPGDVFYIPSGQIHSLGKGIVVAEIQQNSDTTYRLYDYGRPRELHREKALNAAKLRSDSEIEKLQYSGIKSKDCLASCEYFNILRHSGSAQIPHIDRHTVLVAIGGSGTILCDGATYNIHAGDTFFLPEGCPPVTLSGSAVVLEVK